MITPPRHRPSSSRRPARDGTRGFILLMVLVIILLASMISVSLLFSIKADVTAQAAGAQYEQSWATALSGVTRAMTVARASLQDGSADWAENAAAFQHQSVAQDGDDQWYFSIYSAPDSFGAQIRFGLTDENGKLPILDVPLEWFRSLPGLGESFLQEMRPFPPRPVAWSSNPTNEPPPAASTSLEEMFAQAGLPTAALFGEDTNFNLRLDANEDDADATPPADDRNGILDTGLQRLVTVESYDLNVDSEGRPRLDMNDPNTDLSGVGLPQAALDYLVALRRSNRRLRHVVDLLGAKESLPTASGTQTNYDSGIGADEMPTLLDRCTATNLARLPGLINVNTAPAPVLAAIPSLGESGADAIVAARAGLSVEERKTPAWILRRGLVTADQFKELAPRLTTRSYQFTFRSIGYAVPSGRFRVLAVTIDVGTQPSRILALRDLTRFGFPMPLGLLQGETP